MALTAGTRLGPYEITAQIGVGGMGEVYRATDKNLKRQVAIKVLPEAVAADAERLVRFQREAEVLASLNHPNIAIIHGLEKSDGVTGLVMELVEGPTLADRIAQGPIPIDEALPIAKQIAEALEAAHEQGIIHRDLKPANIKVREDGTVKVLDFGLAKAMEPIGTLSPSVSQSPTITTPAMTQRGVILGTAAYMSPEQARGKSVDKRTDIWAFGAVLYEMLTARAAFDGETLSDILAAVLDRPPAWNRLPASTPLQIHRLLRRSLEKDVRRRLRDIGDARADLDPADEDERRAGPAPKPWWIAAVPWAVAGAALVALAAGTVQWSRRSDAPVLPVLRFDVNTPPTSRPFSFALSPDGRFLAFVAEGKAGEALWLRPTDGTVAEELAGTEDASYPFWKPDGRSVGFFAHGKLWRLDLPGGVPVGVADAPTGRGASWSREGMIVFAPHQSSPLVSVTETGGITTPVTQLTAGQTGHRFPDFLPDSRRFLFAATGGTARENLYLGSIDSMQVKPLTTAAAGAMYAPPGYLLLVRRGALFAVQFDAESGTLSGEDIPVAQTVGADATLRGAFSVSATGLLAHRPASEHHQLAWMDRGGKTLGKLGEVDDSNLVFPELSPDGSRVAVRRTVNGTGDIYLIDTSRGLSDRFTLHPESDEGVAVWAPDGQRLIFSATRNGITDLFERPISREADETRVLEPPHQRLPNDWSGTGSLLYQSAGDLWEVLLTGNPQPHQLTDTSVEEDEGQYSPDGQWIAYRSNESDRSEVKLLSLRGSSRPELVSPAGGSHPRWGPGGKEIFYVAPNGDLMAVSVALPADGSKAVIGTPLALFRSRLARGELPRQQYDIGRDGRFLLNTRVEEAPSPITVVQSWSVQLKR